MLIMYVICLYSAVISGYLDLLDDAFVNRVNLRRVQLGKEHPFVQSSEEVTLWTSVHAD